MSIVNVYVGADEAVVVTDTRARLTDGQMAEWTKPIPLLHADSVLVGRELLGFAAMCAMLLTETQATDFDALETAMPDVLTKAFDMLIRGRATTSQDTQEIALVGWSGRGRRMRGVAWQQQDRAVGFVANEIAPWRVGPDIGALFAGTTPGESVHETLMRAARVQTHAVRVSEGPEAVIGGRIVLTTVRRGSISMQIGESLEAIGRNSTDSGSGA